MSCAEHFDAVIVGSGFGGSVMAYRLAEAGMRVCLLERGKAFKPGEFARTPRQMRSNIWDPSHGYYGLFNFWSFKKIDAMVASGLGGGSLIYANVLMRKDERWFARERPSDANAEYWPITRAELDPHYDRVEKMLKPRPMPAGLPEYDELPKFKQFREVGQRISEQRPEVSWQRMPLGITFRNPGEPPRLGAPMPHDPHNIHGRERRTCNLCGECDLGCNNGSKNTLDHTYLSAAKRYGADLRTLCEVRAFAPRQGGGFIVDYVQHKPGDSPEGHEVDTSDGDYRPIHTISADRLILAAGTLGTTFLLMRNSAQFPGLSPMLGARFCGNGDLITFAQRCRDRSTTPARPRQIECSRGPVITGALRVSDRLDGDHKRGFYIQDAGCPNFAPWLMQMVGFPRNLLRARKTVWKLASAALRGEALGNISNDIMEIMLGQAESSASMFPMLGIGRDIPEGQMRLKPDRRGKDLLEVDWKPEYSGPYFRRLRGYMQLIADEMGAEKLFDPLHTFKRTITVHPLGGCPMGRDEHEGVVNSQGEVFNHPGLYIADGSIMPGPVGVNPSLTIAAMADRCADAIIDQHQKRRILHVSYATA